jgi:hypothetical protein
VSQAESLWGDQTLAGDELDWLPTDDELRRLQRTTVLYYLRETNPVNGLVRDKTDPAAPCNIAAIGLALASLRVIAEHGVLPRPLVARIARSRLRFLYELPQGRGRTPRATRDSSTTSWT